MEARATGPVTHTSRATESAAPTATPEMVCPTPDEAVYFDKTEQMGTVLEKALLNNAGQYEMASRNESLFLDPYWQADTITGMDAVRHIINDFKGVVPPPSPSGIFTPN